ncbi:MAG TPA: glycosyltransferase family 9 protein [Xanthobacteraceae bacterium]|nr:glycosyltransferase family 9 protein [Xanthobacteraceae bacterium]
MTSSAVIQVKRGIGDVIWHLPFVRAIAAVSPGRQVTFLAPWTSGAKELLAAEPSVAETVYFGNSGSELRRGLNLLMLVARLRRRRFQQIWILDRTTRPGLAAKLAGIPERTGLGLGRQRFFITNAGIDQSHFHDQPIDWLIALMAAMNVPLPTTEPDLPVAAATLAAIGEKFQHHLRPWIVLGIGGSHPDKDWSDMQWLEFLANLRRRCAGTIFLIGGGQNHGRAKKLIEHTAGTEAINACELTLDKALALLRLADLFIGTDSGPMNLAVASATDAFALFGATPVLTYSKFIHPIVPEGGPSPGGMKRISPGAVLERVEPLLSRVKNPR